MRLCLIGIYKDIFGEWNWEHIGGSSTESKCKNFLEIKLTQDWENNNKMSVWGGAYADIRFIILKHFFSLKYLWRGKEERAEFACMETEDSNTLFYFWNSHVFHVCWIILVTWEKWVFLIDSRQDFLWAKWVFGIIKAWLPLDRQMNDIWRCLWLSTDLVLLTDEQQMGNAENEWHAGHEFLRVH